MPKSTKPAAKRLNATPPELLPEWMDGTPTMIYTLEAFHGETRQKIMVTLDEFEALKVRLCNLRGYSVPEEATHA